MKLEGYEILQEINRGPVATVYLARQVALDRPVFLKVLNKNINDEPDLLERFKREARICARLNHPNIVNIFDFGDAEGSFYLILEYVDGQPLDDLIKEWNPLPLPVVCYIFYEVARGLHYAHKNGVLHRDVKPANIMIGKDGCVKITDFGLATSTDLPNLTLQQSTVGTPAYMSPEQAMGKKVDVRSDIFSLGVTIYEICAGFNPFLGHNIVDTLNRVLTLNPKPLSSVRSDCEDWLNELVNSMLEKKTEQRLPSLQAILDHPSLKENRLDQQQFLKFLENPKEFELEKHEENEPIRVVQETKKQKIFVYSSLILIFFVLFSVFYLTKKPNNPETNRQQTQVDTVTTLRSDTQKVIRKPITENQSLSRNQTAAPLAANPEKDLTEPGAKKIVLPETVKRKKVFKGRLFIMCTPWAEVFIDSIFVDTTPLNEAFELNAGRHHITLKNPNYQNLTKNIEIFPGQSDTLVFHLQPKTGVLQISAFPWGRVFMDDSLVGITPLKLDVPAGRHQLTVENPNFTIYSDTVLVKPGERVEKRIQLKK